MGIEWLLVTLALQGDHDGAPAFANAAECAELALKLNSEINKSRVAALTSMPTVSTLLDLSSAVTNVTYAIESFAESYKTANVDDTATVKLLRLPQQITNDTSRDKALAMSACDTHDESEGKYAPLEEGCFMLRGATSESPESLASRDIMALPDIQLSCIPVVTK